MVSKNPPPAYDHVDSDDDSIPPPPPPTGELDAFEDNEQMDVPTGKPVKKWRMLKKEAEHVLVPQQEPLQGNDFSPETANPSNNVNPNMQGHFRGIANAQQFDEEEAGMDEIEVPSSSVVARMNKFEVSEAKKKQYCKFALVGCVAIAALIAIITGSVLGTRGGGDENKNVVGEPTKPNVDIDNDNADVGEDVIDNEPPEAVNPNMETAAGRFLRNDPTMPDSIKANLEDPDSTTSEAFDWVINDPVNEDYLFKEEGTLDNVVAQVDLKQRLALATFGKSMTVGDDWMTGNNVCQWDGVECDDTNLVNRLVIFEKGMEGTIPPELALLPLEIVSLFSNKISGPIPTELAESKTLTYLDLDSNEMTGEIPAALFSENIESLFLSNNQFTGSLPTTIGDATNLEQLWVNNNSIAGVVPEEIAGAQALVDLLLENNPLVWDLDEADSIFPEAIKELDALERLSMRNNGLKGEFPEFQLGDLPNLKELRLDDNSLTGDLTNSIENLPSLEIFSVSNNAVGGNIPVGLGELKTMKLLDLSFNKFDGEIPKELGNMESLEELYLSNCALENEVPKDLANALNLKMIDISFNELAGRIPARFRFLEKLEILKFNNNFDIFEVHWSICEELENVELQTGCDDVTCDCCVDIIADDAQCA
jgi:hypothetical protein